jgi:hypothetical protein
MVRLDGGRGGPRQEDGPPSSNDVLHNDPDLKVLRFLRFLVYFKAVRDSAPGCRNSSFWTRQFDVSAA